jgi:glycosyltransferase 2 family protein
MRARTVVKVVVSVALLVALSTIVDFGKLYSTLASVSIGHLSLLLLGYALSQVVSAVKWYVVLRNADVGVTYALCLKGYFVGMLVNIAGIGTLGGDMARALLVSPSEKETPTAIASVVADRAHGLAVLSGIGAIALCIFGMQQLPYRVVYLLSGIGFSVVLGWFVGPRLVQHFLPKNSKLRRTVEVSLKVFTRKPSVLVSITILSLLFHLLQIGLHRIMGDALGVSLPWEYLLVAVPFTNIVSTLPISWQGLGVRENAYRFFFTPLVLSNEQAIAFGAMWFFTITVLGCVGGSIALLLSDTPLSTLKPRSSVKNNGEITTILKEKL